MVTAAPADAPNAHGVGAEKFEKEVESIEVSQLGAALRRLRSQLGMLRSLRA